MKSRTSGRKDSRFWLSGSMALALTVLIGGSLLLFPVGGSVTRLSFDLPFAWRSDLVGTVAKPFSHDQNQYEEATSQEVQS
jgi:hypothetical protein